MRDLRGSNCALFTLTEQELVDYLFDRADEPCGKSAPEAVVRYLGLAWKKWGMPPIVSELATGTAVQLRALLSKNNLKAVRKAFNLPLVLVVAAELAVAEPESSGLSPLELAVLGLEVLKVYLSARGHDTQHLCYSRMKWAQEVWGTEEGFVETKTTGAGCRVEVLPAWISRCHSFTGKDWAAAWTTYLEKVELLPPPEPGYILQDPETGSRMTYDVKLRLTRTVWSKLSLKRAAGWLGMNCSWEYVPNEFAQLLGEHSARGVLDTWGLECGIAKERLQFLGRWTPQESVDDYARTSRALVIGVVKEVTDWIQAGGRPDEALTGLRALDRCKSQWQGDQSFLCGDCSWSVVKADQVMEEDGPVFEVERKEELAVTMDTAVEQEEPGELQVETSQTLLLVWDPKGRTPGTLHLARESAAEEVMESACGKTMGRDVKEWTEHRWTPGSPDDLCYSSCCNGYRCKGFFKKWKAIFQIDTDEEAMLLEKEEEVLSEDVGSSSGSS